MIALTFRGIAQFCNDPVGAMADMRAATPSLQACILALVACTLTMVVIDLAYGPYAFRHTVEPGGKRDISAFLYAAIEVARVFGVAAVIFLGARLMFSAPIRVTEALWMSVPFAMALVAFELIQMSTWVLLLATGMNIYGPMFIIGAIGVILVLILSVRTLVPDRDWLACLPIGVGAWFLGTILAPFVLIGTAFYLMLYRRL